jgi:hypothetical protein
VEGKGERGSATSLFTLQNKGEGDVSEPNGFMNSATWWDSSVWFGWLSSNVLLAVPMSIAGTYYVSHQFRRAVAKSMAAAAKMPAGEEREPMAERIVVSQGKARHRIHLDFKQIQSADIHPALHIGRASQWRLLAANVWAGLLYVLVAMGLYLPQVGGFALAKVLVVAAMFSPPLTAAVMIIGNFGYRLMFLALWIHLFVLEGLLRFFGADPWSDPFDLILVPTLALLVLSNRRLRAVGPMMYWGATAVLTATSLGFAYAGLHLIEVLGVHHFVDPELAVLPLPLAGQRWLSYLFNLPPDQLFLTLLNVVNNPLSVLALEHPDRVTGWLIATFHLRALGGFAVGAAIAWVAFRWFARRYREGRASDQMLEIENWWVGFTVVLCTYGLMAYGLPGLIMLAPLVGYYTAMHFGLRVADKQRRSIRAARLLLLRVFGFDKRTQRLLDRLGGTWRFLGPIKLIAGTDLAHSQMEPHEFFNFVTGRLSREFIRSDKDLVQRLRASEEGMDPDGRYRIHEFFCHDDTWRLAVTRLMDSSDVVLMDLRGFSRANSGCIFEIEQLVQSVPLEKVLLIVDKKTDCEFLNQVVQGICSRPLLCSLNASYEAKQLTLVEVSGGGRRSIDALARLLLISADSAQRLSP